MTSIEFSPDDRFPATSAADGSTRIWEVRCGACVGTLVLMDGGREWLLR